MSLTVLDGALVSQDSNDISVYVFDWGAEFLASGVTIATSTWTITAIQPSTSDAALVQDNDSILTGSRKTQIRLSVGTVGQEYEIANKIVTSESPAQTKERSFRLLVERL